MKHTLYQIALRSTSRHQYEHHVKDAPEIRQPQDWAKMPRDDETEFAEPLKVVEGLVKEHAYRSNF